MLDYGIEQERNRLTLYVDGQDRLVLRAIDCDGKKHSLVVGAEGIAFDYGEWAYLCWDFARTAAADILVVQLGAWLQVSRLPPGAIKISDDMVPLVFGSNVDGSAASSIDIDHVMILGAFQTAGERVALGSRMFAELRKPGHKHVRLRGPSHFRTASHPIQPSQPNQPTMETPRSE